MTFARLTFLLFASYAALIGGFWMVTTLPEPFAPLGSVPATWGAVTLYFLSGIGTRP